MSKPKPFDPNPSGLIEHDHNNDGIDVSVGLIGVAAIGMRAHLGGFLSGINT